jgi:hypothetical protein
MARKRAAANFYHKPLQTPGAVGSLTLRDQAGTIARNTGFGTSAVPKSESTMIRPSDPGCCRNAVPAKIEVLNYLKNVTTNEQ